MINIEARLWASDRELRQHAAVYSAVPPAIVDERIFHA
jgi:hypothetical protein